MNARHGAVKYSNKKKEKERESAVHVTENKLHNISNHVLRSKYLCNLIFFLLEDFILVLIIVQLQLPFPLRGLINSR